MENNKETLPAALSTVARSLLGPTDVLCCLYGTRLMKETVENV